MQREQQSFESSISSEKLRQLVRSEGKTARNLVAWSVPTTTCSMPKTLGHGPIHGKTSIGGLAARARSQGNQRTLPKQASQAKPPGRSKSHSTASLSLRTVHNEELCMTVAGQHSALQGQQPPARSNLHARYWSYLFDNLHRAVDEIYCTCEEDESVIECQEVVMTLDACRKDFEALIKRIVLQKAYESSDAENRPSGLAWEVRKTTSPNKPRPQPPCKEHSPRPSPARSLDFGVKETDQSPSLTWADRVRGVRSVPHAKEQQKESHREEVVCEEKREEKVASEDSQEEDREGWEKVTRGRKSRMPSAGKQRANSKQDRISSCSCPVLPSNTVLQHKPTRTETKPTNNSSGSGSTTPAKPDSPPPDAVTSRGSPEIPASEDPATTVVGMECILQSNGQVKNDLITASDLGEHESTPPHTWSDIIAEYDAHETYRQSVSWADRCESPPDILPEVPRSPGRAVQLHQKLSSPSRKRPIEESRRILEERQAKAQQQRDKIQEEKTQKSKIVTEKIREARETRDARARQWREEIEGRLQRAEMLRSSHLQEIVRKAQEEDAKVSEIAFINTMEAQNKKMEVLERHQGHEARMLDLQEERQRKRVEQAAREEAAQERRRVLEAERVAKLMELDFRRREQDAKIEQMRQEREKAREEAAREKARERERKLEARNAAIQLSAEELERRIQLKHNESSRRYDQQLEQKKEKAAVSARHLSSEDAPSISVYKMMKWCSICHVKIISEVYLQSHLRGRRHQETLAALERQQEPSGLIVEAPEEQQGSTRDNPELQERIRAGRKRAKKLRQRMASRVREQEARSQASPSVQTQNQPKLQKALRELGRQLEGSELSAQLDRTLGEMGRSLKSAEDQLCFCQLGGMASLLRLLLVHSEPNLTERRKTLPEKTFQLAVSILQNACSGNTDNCRYFILSNKFSPVVDLVLQHLAVPEPGQPDASESTAHLCGSLLGVLATVLSTLAPNASDSILQQPITDCISYLVCTSVLDRICDYFNSVTGPIDSCGRTNLVMGGVNLLVALSACLHHRVKDVFAGVTDDPSSLITVLQQTDLVGLLPLLYAMLLHDGPPRHFSSPPTLPMHTLSITTAAMKALNNFAILNLQLVQACLGAEGVSLEFRHVVSYLLWYCSHYSSPELLQELILAVGYFCVLNTENQALLPSFFTPLCQKSWGIEPGNEASATCHATPKVFLQSGRSPTLLQLLCGLPFQYFSNPELIRLLFPTLVAACYQQEENRTILQQEISPKLLVAFLQENLQGTQNTSDFSAFSHRFPQTHWKDALQFFSH